MKPKRPGNGWLIAAGVIEMLLAMGLVLMPAVALVTGKVRGPLALLCALFVMVGSGIGAAGIFVQKGRRWAWSASFIVALAWLGLWLVLDLVPVLLGRSVAETISGLQSHFIAYLLGGALSLTLIVGRSAIDAPVSDEGGPTAAK